MVVSVLTKMEDRHQTTREWLEAQKAKLKGDCFTWHAHIEISERDLSSGGPSESAFVDCVGQTCPEILLWSQTHHADQEGVLISALKQIKTENVERWN